ncbi:DUF1566 domain-containing protein [Stenotrophomonas nitritireducens]|uniref:Lcl C-terminal domain-containing protein n=1 Tax=Stenotrophomonas nitritireducens TaxID=83617 RepID=A0ABR5NFN2_9GAMM|nr:DUF1566 domain-containing protein [Stenotrophomonas nitritireducens]KRG54081.1 hypothetical protein ABB22_16800 [Stenotrophomonas nitritireducens]
MTEQSRFTQHADGVVYEPARDLHWTQDDVAGGRMTHADALAAVAKLNAEAFGGFTDWRLPEVEELFLLADRSRCSPAIDITAFPTCQSDWYWTATDDASEEKDEDTGHSDYAWIVYFGYGLSSFSLRGNLNRVRAVRGPARQ